MVPLPRGREERRYGWTDRVKVMLMRFVAGHDDERRLLVDVVASGNINIDRDRCAPLRSRQTL